MKKQRADVLLHETGLAPSREKAQALIMAGQVLVASQRVDKPGQLWDPGTVFTVQANLPFVSRGGTKLSHALKVFEISVAGLTALDAGASTGGFTDCLLQQGVKKVHAVDVGYGQLHAKLRADPRVVVYERLNARLLTHEHLGELVDLVVADLAFISLTKVLPALVACLKPEGKMVLLIKPQFELEPGQTQKGVVRDPVLWDRAIARVQEKAVAMELRVLGVTPSPILGPKGNKEFFIFTCRKKV